MKTNNNKFENVREFWNNRAGLGKWAGSKDIIAKQLEMDAIASYVKDGMNILEIGCGNGITAIEIATRFNVTITAFDYANEMIVSAKHIATKTSCKGTVSFEVGDVLSMPNFRNKFDLIYTERVLINLPDWESQSNAIKGISTLMADGGVYVMCENSQDGLEQINLLRKNVNLEAVVAPWHNCYFNDRDIEQLNISDVILEAVNDYSATYYFLSRVVNACLAAKDGKEPNYDSDINQLALQLPSIGNCGQGRIWLWRKQSINK
jgi:ubiquinone/menaquinone biosynthesis C-methylase UbiE